jgi:hypothetical protein
MLRAILSSPSARHVVTKIEDPFERIVAAVTTDGRASHLGRAQEPAAPGAPS